MRYKIMKSIIKEAMMEKTKILMRIMFVPLPHINIIIVEYAVGKETTVVVVLLFVVDCILNV